MKHYLFYLVYALAIFLSCSTTDSSSQSASGTDATDHGIVLSRLSQPVYPPLPRQARITGIVDLELSLRRDGSVESIFLVSGHPMLKQAALDSAQPSHFECRACTEALTSYSLRYTFELLPPRDLTGDCTTWTDEQRDAHPPAKVDLSHHEITVFGTTLSTCDPSAQLRKVRSVKCVYLWKCSLR